MYKIILFSDECQVWVPLQDTDYGYSGNILVKDPLAQNIFKWVKLQHPRKFDCHYRNIITVMY